MSRNKTYDTDILQWSEEQAALLRQRVGNAIDWDNIAEEIEDVGRSELHAVISLLSQALRHMLKADAWPRHRDAPSWRADAIDFRQQAARRFAPSMRQKIDVGQLYRDALRALPESVDGAAPAPLPEDCSVALDDLLRKP